MDDKPVAGVRRDEVREIFTRSSGPGGQNVNKTSTCVCLKHIPTGIEVRCSRERSQASNRKLAWEMMEERIRSARQKAAADARSRREKERRKRRRRSQAAKSSMLDDKRRRSERKRSRSRVVED